MYLDGRDGDVDHRIDMDGHRACGTFHRSSDIADIAGGAGGVGGVGGATEPGVRLAMGTLEQPPLMPLCAEDGGWRAFYDRLHWTIPSLDMTEGMVAVRGNLFTLYIHFKVYMVPVRVYIGTPN